MKRMQEEVMDHSSEVFYIALRKWNTSQEVSAMSRLRLTGLSKKDGNRKGS